DGIRVDVRAVDTQADYRGRLTQDSHSVNTRWSLLLKDSSVFVRSRCFRRT
ncbi:putative k88 fimbrial protein A, partial [Escherichia coli MP021561.3]